MKTRTKKIWAALLSVLMVLTVLAPVTGVFDMTAKASVGNSPLIGQFFSTASKWEDTKGNGAGLGWGIGDFPSDQLQDGFYHINSFLKIDHTSIFENVTADTGLTLAYTYRPTQNSNHHHILSFGARDASTNAINGDTIKNHFYISATPSWFAGSGMAIAGYVDGNGAEHIKATPNGAPAFEAGKTYDVVVRITSSAITYWINGVEYPAACEADSATYLTQFLSEVHTYQYNYIGRSRWNTGNKWGSENNDSDADFSGYVKNMRVYGSAMTAEEVMADDAYDTYSKSLGAADLSAVLTQTNAINTFTAAAYHQNAEATGAYSNLVYSPAGTTSWSGDGLGDTAWGVGRTDFKVAIPRNVVMVYDGVSGHEPYAPITLESRCNDTGGSSHIIHYVDYDNPNSVYELKNEFWQGYSKTWDAWAKNSINSTEQFAAYWHDGGAPGESPDSQRDGDSRFWWNIIQYYGTGNTTEYYDHESNFQFPARTSYKSTTRQYKTGTITSLTDFYTLNYKPIYDALPSALACYAEMNDHAWMYTEESMNRAKATITQMVMANPNNTDYTYGANVAAAVQNCAINIRRAVTLLGAAGGAYGYAGLNLVKKTGTVTFVNDDGAVLMGPDTYNYGDSVNIYSGTPTKAASAEYTYTFAGWDQSIDPIMRGDVTYTATYTSAKNSYTITWLNDDGSPIDTTTVEYGAVPTHADAVKAADAEYTYTFAGWDPAPAAVTGAAEYTATFTGTKNKYAVTWENWDGTELAVDMVEYGTLPVFDGTPQRPSDDQHHYAFAGWTPELAAVDGPATYRATYEEAAAAYKITFLNDDDSLLEEIMVDYGTLPVYPNADPEKAATAEFTYTFAGWSPELEEVTGVATYRAVYTSVKNKYTITWKNDLGGIIDTTELEYGELPTHADAAKAQTDEYTYAFDGWTPEPSAVIGEAEYTAVFTATKRKYTVTWKNIDGTVLGSDQVEYGETPVYGGATPTIAPDETCHYTFAAWSPTVVSVVGNAVYSATYADEAHTGGTATCAAAATCEICGASYGATASHTLVYVDEQPATQEAAGVVAHYECSVCGAAFSDAEGTHTMSAADLVIPRLAQGDPTNYGERIRFSDWLLRFLRWLVSKLVGLIPKKA